MSSIPNTPTNGPFIINQPPKPQDNVRFMMEDLARGYRGGGRRTPGLPQNAPLIGETGWSPQPRQPDNQAESPTPPPTTGTPPIEGGGINPVPITPPAEVGGATPPPVVVPGTTPPAMPPQLMQPPPGTVFRNIGGQIYSGDQVPLMDYREGYDYADRDAITRRVQDQELVESRLSQLLRGDSRYITDARLRGRTEAASRGMLMGSMAAGSAERAAIQAGMPIAAQDAAWYGQTARDNMDAVNRDLMSDQANLAELFGQSMGIRANLDDSAENRRFQSSESLEDRRFRSDEASLDRGFQGDQSERDRYWRSGEGALDRAFNADQSLQDRTWRGSQAELDRAQQTSQNYLDRQNQRTMAYFQMSSNREVALADALASIYQNPNLKADQQKAAADNARAIFASVSNSIDAALARGVPNVFLNPGPVQTTPPGGG